ncbi:MAG TPA: hypothetical protein VND93_27300, partial [Myxococcales bacterium]|nr:hypothetical protein [Myxococcales bacterium]
KQRADQGDLSPKVYELTKKRAQSNGLEVMDLRPEVKVRIVAAPSLPSPPPPPSPEAPPPTQGGSP